MDEYKRDDQLSSVASDLSSQPSRNMITDNDFDLVSTPSLTFAKEHSPSAKSIEKEISAVSSTRTNTEHRYQLSDNITILNQLYENDNPISLSFSLFKSISLKKQNKYLRI